MKIWILMAVLFGAANIAQGQTPLPPASSKAKPVEQRPEQVVSHPTRSSSETRRILPGIMLTRICPGLSPTEVFDENKCRQKFELGTKHIGTTFRFGRETIIMGPQTYRSWTWKIGVVFRK